MSNRNEPIQTAERGQRLRRRELRSIVPLALVVVLVIAAAILVGHEAEKHLSAFEAWIRQLGPWGKFAFLGVFIVGTCLLVPESLFAFVAGVLFGLAWGLALMLVGNVLAAALQYVLAHRLLHAQIQGWLEARPLLASIQRAVKGNELRLQVLLRLTPLNPALTSYLLGAAGVRFPGFMLASMAVMAFVSIEVYLGNAGNQLISRAASGAQQPWHHELLMYGSAVLGIIACVVLSRVAHAAVLRAINEAGPPAQRGQSTEHSSR